MTARFIHDARRPLETVNWVKANLDPRCISIDASVGDTGSLFMRMVIYSEPDSDYAMILPTGQVIPEGNQTELATFEYLIQDRSVVWVAGGFLRHLSVERAIRGVVVYRYTPATAAVILVDLREMNERIDGTPTRPPGVIAQIEEDILRVSFAGRPNSGFGLRPGDSIAISPTKYEIKRGDR